MVYRDTSLLVYMWCEIHMIVNSLLTNWYENVNFKVWQTTYKVFCCVLLFCGFISRCIYFSVRKQLYIKCVWFTVPVGYICTWGVKSSSIKTIYSIIGVATFTLLFVYYSVGFVALNHCFGCSTSGRLLFLVEPLTTWQETKVPIIHIQILPEEEYLRPVCFASTISCTSSLSIIILFTTSIFINISVVASLSYIGIS